MKIKPFALERYFAQHEFSARYLLSSSDCESLSMRDILAYSDDDTKRMWEELKFGYTESPGHPILRQEIAAIYEGFDADKVIVLAPEEGIFLLMHALLESGDHVVCTFPGYQSLHEVALSIGCEVSTWEPDENKGWQFDVDQLEAGIRTNTKLIVINFPHNPTGWMPSPKEFQEIINLAEKHGISLLSDEMYRYLEIDPSDPLPAACELYENAFSLFGLSKSFGLPGLRIGWIATHNEEIMNRINQLKDYTTICSSAPSEILAIMALRGKERIFAEQRRRLERNLAMLSAFFAHYSDLFSWNKPRGGSLCFPRMLEVDDTLTYCEQLVNDTGIMLVPSVMFQYGNQHVRA